MAKCPDCGGAVEETYDEAQISDVKPSYITIGFTRIIRCRKCGTFKQHYQTKRVELP